MPRRHASVTSQPMPRCEDQPQPDESSRNTPIQNLISQAVADLRAALSVQDTEIIGLEAALAAVTGAPAEQLGSQAGSSHPDKLPQAEDGSPKLVPADLQSAVSASSLSKEPTFYIITALSAAIKQRSAEMHRLCRHIISAKAAGQQLDGLSLASTSAQFSLDRKCQDLETQIQNLLSFNMETGLALEDTTMRLQVLMHCSSYLELSAVCMHFCHGTPVL